MTRWRNNDKKDGKVYVFPQKRSALSRRLVRDEKTKPLLVSSSPDVALTLVRTILLFPNHWDLRGLHEQMNLLELNFNLP